MMSTETIQHGAALDRLLDAIERAGYRVTDRKATTARAQCPAHQGNGPSLSVFSTETRVNTVCHSRGCTTEDVFAAVGLDWRDRYHERRAEYVYDNGRKVRRSGDNGKSFPQSGADNPPILYRLARVRAAVAAGDRVLLVEGEEDVHAAEAVGAVATTAPMGARNFSKVDVSPLAGAVVVAMADDDDNGAEWAVQVAERVGPVASSLRFVRAKTGKDLCDHLAAGHTLADLVDVEGAAEDLPRPSWAPVDLTAYLNGTHVTPKPTQMIRSHGVGLLYPGKTHSFHGESESGKSLVAQAESARVLNDGGRVLFLDFESDPASVVERLVDMGADPAAIAARFTYSQPEADLRSPAELAAFDQMLAGTYELAVIDGVTVSLGLFGGATKDNDDVTAWSRLLPDRIARKTGAAVVCVDHVTKDSESRGRFAIGGQAKMSALTGAAYVVEVLEPLGRGLRGVVALRVAKDRPGYIRARSGLYRAKDRTQEAARVVVDSTGHHAVVTVEAPRGDVTHPAPFRPTALMEKLSRHLEQSGTLSGSQLRKAVPGKDEAKLEALETLAMEGFVSVVDGPRNARLHASIKPYRQTGDPQSDQYVAGEQVSSAFEPSTCSPSYTGEQGNRSFTRSGNRSGTGQEQETGGYLFASDPAPDQGTPAPPTAACSACGRGLTQPHSIAAGQCETCYLTGERTPA